MLPPTAPSLSAQPSVANRKRLARQISQSAAVADDSNGSVRRETDAADRVDDDDGGGGGSGKRSRASVTDASAPPVRDSDSSDDRKLSADEPRARSDRSRNVDRALGDGELKNAAPSSVASGGEQHGAEERFDWTRVGTEKTRELRLIVTRAVYRDEGEAQRRARLDRLPGPLPATLRRAHLATLDPADYWLCEKSDGERMMLLATRTDVWLVNRKFRFLHVQTRRGGAELVSALVDGELVRNLSPSRSLSSSSSRSTSAMPPHDRWKNHSYLAFDILVASDRNLVADTPFRSRIDEMTRAFEHPASAAAHASDFPKPSSSSSSSSSCAAALPPPPPELVLPVKCKKFVRLVDAAYSFSKISRDVGGRYVFEDAKRDMRHLNDGAVLTPNLGGYLCLDQRAPLLKWKWPGMHTLDFKIRRPFFDGQGMLQLWAGGPQGTDVMVRKTAISQYERATLLQEMTGADESGGGGGGGGEDDGRDDDRVKSRGGGRSGGDGSDPKPDGRRRHAAAAADASAVFECAYEPQSSRWRVKSRRRDKSEPNFITTVIATLETIVDHVTRDELIQFGQPRPQRSTQPRPGTAPAPAAK